MNLPVSVILPHFSLLFLICISLFLLLNIRFENFFSLKLIMDIVFIEFLDDAFYLKDNLMGIKSLFL